MKYLVGLAGRSGDFEIASAAVSTEEIGNDLYPQAQRKLREKGIPFAPHAARQITPADYRYYDYIVCMDHSNQRWMQYVVGQDFDKKVSLLLEWSGKTRNVADPWYTGDFETAYNDILEGCQAMLAQLW